MVKPYLVFGLAILFLSVICIAYADNSRDKNTTSTNGSISGTGIPGETNSSILLMEKNIRI